MIDRLILWCLRNKKFIRFLLLFTTLIILLLTLLPTEQVGKTGLYEYDKIGHFVVFFGWTFLFGLVMFTKKKAGTKFLLVFMIGCLFGIAIEIFQEILPVGRNMDIRDIYTDILGSLSAIVLLISIKRRYINSIIKKQLEEI